MADDNSVTFPIVREPSPGSKCPRCGLNTMTNSLLPKPGEKPWCNYCFWMEPEDG